MTKREIVVMEFADGKTLSKRIDARPLNYTEDNIRCWLGETLRALHYIHTLPERIVHFDIKPDNILLMSDGTIKVADFGLSLKTAGLQVLHHWGTVTYTAPENFDHHTVLGPKSDIFSVGAIAYELVFGFNPIARGNFFRVRHTSAEKKVQVQSTRFDFTRPAFCPVSPPMIGIMQNMLSLNPNARQTAAQLLRIPYIRDPLENRESSKLLVAARAEIAVLTARLAAQARMQMTAIALRAPVARTSAPPSAPIVILPAVIPPSHLQLVIPVFAGLARTRAAPRRHLTRVCF